MGAIADAGAGVTARGDGDTTADDYNNNHNGSGRATSAYNTHNTKPEN